MADIAPMISGLFSSFGTLFRPGAAAGSAGASQFQTQSVTQSQANVQTVNIGSTVGGDPSGLGVPLGASVLDLTGLSNLLGGGPTTSISTAPASVVNWKYVGIGAAAFVGVWFLTSRRGRVIRRYYRRRYRR